MAVVVVVVVVVVVLDVIDVSGDRLKLRALMFVLQQELFVVVCVTGWVVVWNGKKDDQFFHSFKFIRKNS